MSSTNVPVFLTCRRCTFREDLAKLDMSHHARHDQTRKQNSRCSTAWDTSVSASASTAIDAPSHPHCVMATPDPPYSTGSIHPSPSPSALALEPPYLASDVSAATLAHHAMSRLCRSGREEGQGDRNRDCNHDLCPQTAVTGAWPCARGQWRWRRRWGRLVAVVGEPGFGGACWAMFGSDDAFGLLGWLVGGWMLRGTERGACLYVQLGTVPRYAVLCCVGSCRVQE